MMRKMTQSVILGSLPAVVTVEKSREAGFALARPRHQNEFLEVPYKQSIMQKTYTIEYQY